MSCARTIRVPSRFRCSTSFWVAYEEGVGVINLEIDKCAYNSGQKRARLYDRVAYLCRFVTCL